MSDETSTTVQPRQNTVLYVHYCEHLGCARWGTFGFAVGKAEPHWFCSEHRPEWKTEPAASH